MRRFGLLAAFIAALMLLAWLVAGGGRAAVTYRYRQAELAAAFPALQLIETLDLLRAANAQAESGTLGDGSLLRRAALPRIRFHDLRHSCLSLLAAQGVPARVAMDIAGHSDIRLTLSVYTHVYDEAKQQVADVMDRLFPGTLEAGD